MLNYNTQKYDFNPVEEIINKFYPVGLSNDFYNYPGLKELENIIVENIHEENNFQLRWKSFESEIKSKTNKEIIGTTFGQYPCFSSSLSLGIFNIDNLTRFKTLEFFVSLTGPFYTVIGVDRNEIKIADKKIHSHNFLVISPEAEYKNLFTTICELIETRFKNFKFVPYFIYSQNLYELSEQYKMEQNIETVFNALFNGHIKFNAETIGDKYFGDKLWVKQDFIDPGPQWIIYP